MKGIIGRKLGMTQVFDEETGKLTPVTVIQAGPCPVVAVRTQDTDGYDAVQLAFDAVAEGRLTKPRLGHLKKHDVAPHKKLVDRTSSPPARPSPSRRSSRARRSRSPGSRSGRASRERSSATGSTEARSRTAPTTSASRAPSELRRRLRGSSRE
jgi:hypothetical protein